MLDLLWAGLALGCPWDCLFRGGLAFGLAGLAIGCLWTDNALPICWPCACHILGIRSPSDGHGLGYHGHGLTWVDSRL
jgi:hypothetical protein